MIRVKKDWWKDFFNHIYLITDSRSINDGRLTSREVDLLEQILNLNKTDRILDLCGGQGRHSIELSKRGYCNLTVLDYSKFLINLGKKLAKNQELNIRFHQADARCTRLKSNTFSVIIVMANSLGYFPNEQENLQVLKETNRLLKPNGKILLDLADPIYTRDRFKPVSWHRIGGVDIFRIREIKNNLVKTQEIVICEKQGLLRNGCYCARLYSKSRINQLLVKAGFRNININKNVRLHKKKQDYGMLTSRMIVTATK